MVGSEDGYEIVELTFDDTSLEAIAKEAGNSSVLVKILADTGRLPEARMKALINNWRICGTGDFNGDGNEDILWRLYASGHNRVWFMNSTVYDSYKNLARFSKVSWRIHNSGGD